MNELGETERPPMPDAPPQETDAPNPWEEKETGEPAEPVTADASLEWEDGTDSNATAEPVEPGEPDIDGEADSVQPDDDAQGPQEPQEFLESEGHLELEETWSPDPDVVEEEYESAEPEAPDVESAEPEVTEPGETGLGEGEVAGPDPGDALSEPDASGVEAPETHDSDVADDGYDIDKAWDSVDPGDFAENDEAAEHGSETWVDEASVESDDKGDGAEEPEQTTMGARAYQPASAADTSPAESNEMRPDVSTSLARDQTDPEGAFLGGAWERVRAAVFDGKPVEQPEEIRATVERPAFNEMRVEEIGIALVEYGSPLEHPDGERVPLFDGSPRRDQTQQGSLNDCGVISTLGAVAGHRPDDIAGCVRENGDGTYEVTLHQVKHSFDGDWRHYEATGGKTVLTVTPDIPVSALSPESPAYASTRGGEMAWVAVMEKALAGVDQTWDDERPKRAEGYSRLDLGTRPDDRAEMLTQITGLPAYTEDFPKSYDMQGRSPDRQLLDTFREKLDSGFPVLVGTVGRKAGDPPLIKDLIHGHAYEVVAVDDRNLIHLRNPHNVDQPDPLTVSEFRKNIKNRYTTLE